MKHMSLEALHCLIERRGLTSQSKLSKELKISRKVAGNILYGEIEDLTVEDIIKYTVSLMRFNRENNGQKT